jgi:hypothetical protein
MSSYSLTILGTDFIGLSLSQTLLQEHEAEKLALVGEHPTDSQNNNLDDLFSSGADLQRFPEAFEGEDNIRQVVTQTISNLGHSLGHLGGRLVDLKVDTDGFVLLVQEGDTLTELFTHHLIVTAPPLLDVLERGLVLPGTDSAVTGLLLDRTGLDFHGSNDIFETSLEDRDAIWDLNFGFESDEHGTTSNLKISVTGQAAQGPTTADTLKNLVESIESLPEPTPHYNESFDKEGWEDTSMPEGFVETKTSTLKELLQETIEDDRDPEALTHELEGLAGEIDSYSRFRSDPDLQRLRWKTLAAMNFAQPFLQTDQTVNA